MNELDIIGIMKEMGTVGICVLWSIHLFRRDGQLKSSMESIANTLTKLDTKLDTEVSENKTVRSAIPGIVHAQAVLMDMIRRVEGEQALVAEAQEETQRLVLDLHKYGGFDSSPSVVKRVAEVEKSAHERMERRSYYPANSDQQRSTPVESPRWSAQDTSPQVPRAKQR